MTSDPAGSTGTLVAPRAVWKAWARRALRELNAKTAACLPAGAEDRLGALNSGCIPTAPSPDYLQEQSPSRIGAPRPSPRLCERVGATLASITPHFRTKVYAAYRSLGGRRGRLNDQRRALLSEAIFQIEDDLEHRQPRHPQVRAMRAARNRLYDDLGWNERPIRTASTSIQKP